MQRFFYMTMSIVCYTAFFSVVTQRTKNGCVVRTTSNLHYQAPTLRIPASGRLTPGLMEVSAHGRSIEVRHKPCHRLS